MSTLEVSALKPLIGSEVRADVETLTSGRVSRQLRDLLLERGVLVFRDLELTRDQQREITGTIGRIRQSLEGDELEKVSADKDEAPALAGYVETTFFWHMDGNIRQTVPCFGGSFRPVRLADDGGQTEFLNAYAAYEGLDADTRHLVDRLWVVHSLVASGLTSTPDAGDEELAGWRSAPRAKQPLVWEHEDGRKSLMLGLSISHIDGMYPADSFELLNSLRAHAMRDEYVYSHDWRENDLVIWNNTGTLHRARPYSASSGRLMHRFTLEGEEPIRAPRCGSDGPGGPAPSAPIDPAERATPQVCA